MWVCADDTMSHSLTLKPYDVATASTRTAVAHVCRDPVHKMAYTECAWSALDTSLH